MADTRVRKHRVRCGLIVAGRVYDIAYRCDTPGPDIEEGIVCGFWTGEIDTWGKLTVQVFGFSPTRYLFDREFMQLDRVPE
jgi:hypothetical protein